LRLRLVLDLPAERMAAATAWLRGWPARIISAMLELMVAWLEPFLSGIIDLSTFGS
jgi:hypothetical protein